MKKNHLSALLLAALFLAEPSLEASWLSSLTQSFSSASQTKLDETQIGKGIKEALSVGIDRAVASASRDGGFMNNEKIRILLPKPLQKMEPMMRKVGLGAQLDDFQKSMNQAAEKAAPAAKNILLDSVGALTLEDAQKIWKGGDTAATDFFRAKSHGKLQTALMPLVTSSLSRYDVTAKYNQLAKSYQALPIPSKPKLSSIEEYATTKTLDGLFLLLAEEEKRIRTDPKARVTDLLRQVFSSSSKAK